MFIKFNIVKTEKVFFNPPKYFNSPPFIDVGRKIPFLVKNEIQALHSNCLDIQSEITYTRREPMLLLKCATLLLKCDPNEEGGSRDS